MKEVKIITSKVAAHVITKKYGYKFNIDRTIHKSLIKTLLLPCAASTRLKDKEAHVFLFLPCKWKLSKKVGVHLHEWVMSELCVFLDAQTELDPNISQGILNFMDKYDLDDGILQLDTAKKHYYRYRIKKAELKIKAENSIKMMKVFNFSSKTNTVTVPLLFKENSIAFISFLNDLSLIIQHTTKHLNLSIDDLLNKSRKSNIVHGRKCLALILYYGMKFRLIDIATYFNISEGTAHYYIDSVRQNPDFYTKDLYQIFTSIMNTFEKELVSIEKM